MPTNRINDAHLTVITRAYVVHSPLARNTARPRRMLVVPRAAEMAAMPQEPAVAPGNVGKGLAWALTLEGAGGLAFYAVWHFWHMLPLHF